MVYDRGIVFTIPSNTYFKSTKPLQYYYVYYCTFLKKALTNAYEHQTVGNAHKETRQKLTYYSLIKYTPRILLYIV